MTDAGSDSDSGSGSDFDAWHILSPLMVQGGYLPWTTGSMRPEDLDTLARVLHAPLKGEPPWYELAGLDGIPDGVDLLVVDGPPAFDSGHGGRRAPALPWFAGRLVAGAAVMLDDVNRPGEQAVTRGWEASTDWRFFRDRNIGLATGRRDPEARNP